MSRSISASPSLPLAATAQQPQGAGPEFQALLRQLVVAHHHSRRPLSRRSLSDEFAMLAAIWAEDTEFCSSGRDIVMHPAYQRIIALGPRVVPLILRELAARSDHWFWALAVLTGVNPVPPEHAGDVRAMRQIWLAWARQQKLLD